MNNKESLYRKIWVVALPIIFQNIIDASVNSADVLMLNYVGQDAISAVSLANSLVGILFMLLYGIGTGIAMLAAFVFKLPVKVVFFLLCTDEFVTWPWVLKHFYSHKWARNITREEMD